MARPGLFLPLLLPFVAFCTLPRVVRRASGGVEVSVPWCRAWLWHGTQGDAEMLKKLKAWKKTRGGFEKQEVKEAVAPAVAPPEAGQTLPRALEAGFRLREGEASQAVSELLQRGQQEVSPNEFTPQQLIRVGASWSFKRQGFCRAGVLCLLQGMATALWPT